MFSGSRCMTDKNEKGGCNIKNMRCFLFRKSTDIPAFKVCVFVSGRTRPGTLSGIRLLLFVIRFGSEKKIRLFPKFQSILIFRLQVMHDYVH